MTNQFLEHDIYKYEGQNLICAVDIRTNGPLPGFHDIIEINILPLDKDFNRSKGMLPFHARIYPKRQRGEKSPPPAPDLYHYDKAFEIFDAWFNTLNIRAKARIVPLCYNWAKTKPFLDDFFGHDLESESYTDLYFHKEIYKDIKASIFFMKDGFFRKYFYGYDLPIFRIYGRSSFVNIMKILEIVPAQHNNHYHICVDLANTYKKLIEIFPL